MVFNLFLGIYLDWILCYGNRCIENKLFNLVE